MVKQSENILIEKHQLHELHREYETYLSLFTHYPGMMFSLNLNGYITNMNGYGEQFAQQNGESVLNKHYTEFIIHADRKKVEEAFRNTLAGKISKLQTTLIHVTRNRVDVEIITIPIYINNKVDGAFSIVRDITLERKTAVALKESQEKYRLIAEHTSELISLVNVENDTVIYASPSHETILGYSPHYYLGRSITLDVYPGDKRSISNLLKNDPQDPSPAVVEFRRKHANGSWLCLEDRATLIPSGLDNERTLVVVTRDITEKKEAERELKQTLKQLKDMKYALDESALVSIADKRGKITSVNDKFCETSGYMKKELIGEEHMILDSGYHPESFFTEMRSKISKGEVWKGEINNKKKNGEVFWVDTTIVPFLDDEGEPYQYVYIRKDITNRKQTEEFLRTSDKLSVIGELAAGVAHEIRNPLTSLKGFTQILKSRLSDESDQEFIKIMMSELDRINMIVNEFMVLARPQAVTYEKANILDLIENVLTLIETQAILNNVQIFTRLIKTVPAITCSENQIKQVLINVLKNAIEAMPDGGEIVVSVYVDSTDIMIEVKDNGTGIPDHQLSHLGEPFYTTKKKGNGLGLMICRRIIQNHKGEMTFASEEGLGTTVAIKLPLDLQQ
ncbi:PAS domain S-box protein [Guptibacillus algicola]|uniref:PAS domain S-box protein n=1 Tax=Guptibacillus algicola TaxID=225844 RepID=UPI001CD7DCDC|nr:PAS domain S-box protein [Alkalihalobacillus algicola]MCA0987727.1 PAS domain S-box protein [Alkalihalobacillus algicola]